MFLIHRHFCRTSSQSRLYFLFPIPGPPTYLLLLAASLLMVAAWLSRKLSSSTLSLAFSSPGNSPSAANNSSPSRPPIWLSVPPSSRHDEDDSLSHTVHTGEASLHISHATPVAKHQHQHQYVPMQQVALDGHIPRIHDVRSDALLEEPSAAATTDPDKSDHEAIAGPSCRWSVRLLALGFRDVAVDAYECTRLIAKSPYLVALCCYMLLQCCTAAMLVSFHIWETYTYEG